MAAPRSQRSTSNLPRELTSFVGRSRELAELTGLLEREPRRLMTLVGPPDTGKMRLALRVSRELRDSGTLLGGAWSSRGTGVAGHPGVTRAAAARAAAAGAATSKRG